MKYVFVGDIHGRVEDVERALALDGKKIFVGDFVDSFDQSIGNQRKCLDLVLSAIKAGEARSLFGNHELSYFRKGHRCSGWNAPMHAVMQADYREELDKHFEPFAFLEPNILVTHAGLTRHIWARFGGAQDILADVLKAWWPDDSSPMHWIGQIRGGSSLWGGPFWCHFPNEFEPIPELVQIFGHTGSDSIRADGNNFCIDNSRTRVGEMDFLTMEL